MKTLSRLVAKSWPGIAREGLVFALWVVAISFLEIVGRHVASDLGDCCAMLGVAFLVLLTVMAHGRRPLSWVKRLVDVARRVGKRLRSLGVEIGIDFRETPPIPPGVPRALSWALVGLGITSLALALLRGYFPDAARQLLVSVSYTAYLALLAVLWTALLTGILLTLFFPCALIHDWFVSTFTGQGRRPVRNELAALTAFAVVLLALGLALPGWVPLAITSLCFAFVFALLALPSTPDLLIVWKRRHTNDGLRTMRFRRYAAIYYLVLLLDVAILVLAARGNRLPPVSSTFGAMILTPWLGLVFAWCAAVGSGALAWHFLRTVRLGRFQNPAVAEQPVVFVQGDVPLEQQEQLRLRLGRHDWQVRFQPAAQRKLDVPIRLVEESADAADRLSEPRWPLAVTWQNVCNEENLRRYARRDEIQKRRWLTRGLEKLFKRAARREYSNGEGFWIGLNHWYITGLCRDASDKNPNLEEDTVFEEIIGPPYHRVFPRAVRHHFHQVMKSLELDLMFVEDGVGYRRLRKVLGCMFEVYDVYGGRQRAEEKHFSGLPKVRVIIHDFRPDESPFRSEKYPEPDYEDVGRARILHVFLDRGEDEEEIETPREDVDVPVFSLV